MKCKHCGSRWESKTDVTECPFCHKSLNTDTDAPKTLTTALVQIRDQMGVETLGKGKAVLSCFKDLAPELKREYTMLSHLENADGIKTLFQAKDKAAEEQEVELTKVVRRLVDNFVAESAAESACRIYMQVLTGRENEAQKSDSNKEKETKKSQSDADLAEFRQKLTERLREQVPAQMAATPKPAAPPKPAVSEFQTDGNGKLLKYNGRASVVRVPDHIKIIGAKAFERNQMITHVVLPMGLVSIEQEAFACCLNLRDVSFPVTLQSIGDKAFWACNGLREVTLPGSIKTVAPLAFWSCRNLTRVVLCDGITALGVDAFNYCTGLKEIHLPKSLQSVHPHAFTGAQNAKVWGNIAWIVKDGHVVANTPADTTYRNAGASQKTVIAPPAKQPHAEQPKPPVTPPKPPVTPPKPSVTPSKPPVTPKAAPAAKPAKQKPFIMRLLGALMYPAWGAAIFMFFDGIEPINDDGSFYIILPVMLVLFLLGRLLFNKKRVFWGLLLSFLAAGNLIQFFEFSTDNTINELIIFTYPILCAITSFCHGPILKRFKK